MGSAHRVYYTLGCSVILKFSFINFVLVLGTGHSFKIPARNKHKPLWALGYDKHSTDF